MLKMAAKSVQKLVWYVLNQQMKETVKWKTPVIGCAAQVLWQ
jgi:hypothetical protein